MEADTGICWILHSSKSAYAALRNRKPPEKMLFGKVDLMAQSSFLGVKSVSKDGCGSDDDGGGCELDCSG